MKVVQFDECLDDRRLVNACTSEGIVDARRFPRSIRNRAASDEEVLRKLLPQCDLFVTKDRMLAEQNPGVLEPEHSGILIVTLGPEATRTITTKLAGEILKRFKETFPRWHEVPCGNSIIQLAPDRVEVQHVAGGALVRDAFIERRGDLWQSELESHLRSNAERPDAESNV